MRTTSTRLAFLVAGLGTACWASLVPFARARLGVGDAGLGLLLLTLGVGSITAMPAAGLLAQRIGCRPVILGAGILLCADLPLLAAVPGVPAMAGCLALFGAALGALDVAMNVQAVRVEDEAGRPLMSGFHGLYSAGGILGALGMGGLLALGAGPLAAACCLAAGCMGLLLAAAPTLPPGGGAGAAAPLLALPRGPVLLIGLLCAVSFLAEGAMVDWSALLLRRSSELGRAWSGAGYAAFSATMTLGRLGGDRLVRRLGGRAMLVGGGLLCSAGLLVAVAGGGWPLSLTGFALAGAGAANLAPLLIGAAGRQPESRPELGIAAAGTLGYAGILAGPGLIGLAAQAVGLPAALALVALLLLAVPAGAAIVARPGALIGGGVSRSLRP